MKYLVDLTQQAGHEMNKPIFGHIVRHPGLPHDGTTD